MIGKKEMNELPLVPLDKLVLFPHTVIPIFLGKNIHSAAVDAAMKGNREIFVTTKKEVDSNDKENNDKAQKFFSIGTKARILQVLKMPDKTFRVLIEGQQRGRISHISTKENHRVAQVTLFKETTETDNKAITMMKILLDIFEEYSKNNRGIPKEVKDMISKAEFPDKLVDLICGNSRMTIEQKIELLEIEESVLRLEKAAQYLQTEIELSLLQNKIKVKVKEKMEQKQKEYFLNEQIREINKELGRIPEDIDEFSSLNQRLEEKKLPQEIYEKAKKELNRLSSLQPMSPESGILRFYLEWLLDLPWNEYSEDNLDIALAKQILNEDHFGLEKPKERILDFIAVTQLNKKAKGPILCFTGPPGTGKTSLGRSVARALNREFVRISLGGIRDEAEIRGHRKTYIGALPGKIIQSMKKAKTVNPVFLLDEMDKINSDYRGDPASALLEVLDPEQNSTFVDHYIELPYDLSQVMFIATANSVHKIPHALRDRMEIIELPGYTDLEKIHIAENFIIPKQLRENGLGWAKIHFTKNSISKLINEYTMESGVRNLERVIASVIRKVGRAVIEQGYAQKTDEEKVNAPFKSSITEKKIVKLLGKNKFNRDILFHSPRAGNINGLAWTETGGTLLPIEAIFYEGKEELILTGSLGDVMKESAQTALSFIKSNREHFELEKDFCSNKAIHLHVPEGAIPKDGPSAGITMAAAIYSAFSNTAPNENFAMTGEITLTGKVLPIGGLKEKVLAAYRNNIKNIIVPHLNINDIEQIPKEVKHKINFYFVKHADQVISILFDKTKNTHDEQSNEN